MIFVIVGLMHGFDRLVKKMDDLSKSIQEKVIIQIGDGTYIPRYAEYYRFLDEDTFNLFLDNSRIVISHAGIGTIITVFNKNKPIIIVPRCSKYKEHMDDHQLEIAKEFKNNQRIKVVYNVNNLSDYLNIKFLDIDIYKSEKTSLQKKLKKYLTYLEKQ